MEQTSVRDGIAGWIIVIDIVADILILIFIVIIMIIIISFTFN